jgi:hypothetical protein
MGHLPSYAADIVKRLVEISHTSFTLHRKVEISKTKIG